MDNKYQLFKEIMRFNNVSLFLSSSGAQHLNINLQMNYWPSLSCNLRECQEPLFDYISSLSVNGSKTAKVFCFFTLSFI
jgi:hypothetical protein